METRLTDIVKVFSDKWTYGAVEFGYESDINTDHDRQYPALIIEPPVSVIESVNVGRENYDFELNFYNLYDTAAQDVVELQKRWDNLQDLANEWLDVVLKNYQDTTVQAYIDESGVSIERVKEVGNDRLVQLKINFTMSGFTKCFRPVSAYPSDISDLVIWYKADSGATFDTPTKALSELTDQTPSSTSFVSQSTKSKQPLRYGYDGANDKTYIKFDGTNDSLTSNIHSPITTEFTAFYVGKVVASNTETGIYLGYMYDSSIVKLGSNSNKIYSMIIDFMGNELEILIDDTDTSVYHIGMYRLEGQTLRVDYDSLGNSQSDSTTNSSYNTSNTFDRATFDIGFIDSGDNSDYLNGNFEELIVFNKKLNDTEIADVKRYLNDKYNIY
jgi:hypothetical protein